MQPTDEQQTTTEAADRWMRDGHTARVVLDEDCLRVYLSCPYARHTFEGAAFDLLPECRRGYDEAGEPDPGHSPLGYCNFLEWLTDGDPLDSVAPSITRGVEWTVVGEFPIGIRWNGDYYEWAPSALIDAERVTS